MIDELNQFYNNNSNLINLISILFGIAGTVIGIITWRDSKKSKKSYEYLFELAEKNIDKSVTDQQLSEKKKEIEEASQRIEALQEQIRKDIPIEARRTVLKDKLNSQIELLKQHFDSSKKIRDELANMGDTQEIPHDLLKSIEKEISPEYILHENRSKKNRTYHCKLSSRNSINSITLSDG